MARPAHTTLTPLPSLLLDEQCQTLLRRQRPAVRGAHALRVARDRLLEQRPRPRRLLLHQQDRQTLLRVQCIAVRSAHALRVARDRLLVQRPRPRRLALLHQQNCQTPLRRQCTPVRGAQVRSGAHHPSPRKLHARRQRPGGAQMIGHRPRDLTPPLRLQRFQRRAAACQQHRDADVTPCRSLLGILSSTSTRAYA